MTNGNSSSNGNSFNLLSFLLGLAIGLWISFVVFFVMDRGDDCNCGPGGTTIITYPQADGAYVPGGDGDYFCTNNDEGRAIVIDEGRAVVADEGRAIVIDEGRSIVADEGRAIVIDEGRAVVADAGGFVPAPGSDSEQLDRDRQFEEFLCDTNDEGGAIVADRADRAVVVAMPLEYDSEQCKRVNGNAVVVVVVNGANRRIQIDEGGAIVPDEGSVIVADGQADSSNDQTLGTDVPISGTALAYCMVVTAESVPVVIRPPPGTYP